VSAAAFVCLAVWGTLTAAKVHEHYDPDPDYRLPWPGVVLSSAFYGLILGAAYWLMRGLAR
jgi:hypothetical protein